MISRLALVGCGHIGGSLALALRGEAREIVGYDASPAAGERALARGIVGSLAASAEEAARGAELVVLAVPVRAIPALVGVGGEVVTDVGSTKAKIVAAGEAARGGRFVGGHPIAGTERAGPDAADAGLFRGRRVILTPTERSEAAAVELVTRMWQAAGATVVTMDAAIHDRLMAAISHLPHVAAYALAKAIGGDRELVGFTGGGYADTTRIASTPPGMWIDVFLENRGPLLDLIDRYQGELGALRAAIEAGDARAIEAILTAARGARERILG